MKRAALLTAVAGIPEKLLISRDGSVVKKFIGPMSEERLTRILNDLLGEPVVGRGDPGR